MTASMPWALWAVLYALTGTVAVVAVLTVAFEVDAVADWLDRHPRTTLAALLVCGPLGWALIAIHIVSGGDDDDF